MSIDLDDIRQRESSALGNVTNLDEFTGDISGSRNSGLTVIGVNGNAIDTTNALSIGQGYVLFADPTPGNPPKLYPTPIVYQNLDTTAGGVTGNFDTGLNLSQLYGATFPATGQSFDTPGQGLTFNGDDIVVTQLLPYRNLYVTSDVTSQNRDVLNINTVTGAVTISLPDPAINGDYVVFNFLTADIANPIVNTVTITGPIQGGDTSLVLNILSSVRLTFVEGVWIPFAIGTPKV